MNKKMIKSVKFLTAGLLFSCFSLYAEETRGIFSFLGDKKEPTKIEQKIAQKEEVSAVIENLDQLTRGGFSCMDCCPPKRLKVCEVCAKRIYAMCLFAEVAKIKDICAKQEKVEKIWSYVADTCKLCAKKAKIEYLWTDKARIECAQIEKLCTDCAAIKKLFAEDADIKKLWADHGCIEHLYTEKLWAKDTCSNYKATMTMANPFIGYVIDAGIKFDTISDDPNNNVNNSGAETEYIAPKTGYYTFNLSIDSGNLRGGPTLSGQPILHPVVKVNGIHRCHADTAMLSFANNTFVNLSGLLHINKGDVVTVGQSVFYVDPTTGLTEYPGVLDFGNPIPPVPDHPSITFFMIHYLSSDCENCQYPPCHEPCHHLECHVMPPCDCCHEECGIQCPENNECCSDCHNN